MIAEGVETKRLRLRKLEERDKEPLREFFDHPQSFDYLWSTAGVPDVLGVWFERQWARYEANRGGLCAVVLKETDEIVGQCGLLVQDIDGEPEWEIGYHIIPRFWGKGFATEAAIGVKEFAREKKVAKYIISTIHVENVASQKIAKRNGMTIWKETTYKDLPVQIWRVDIENIDR